MDGHPRLRCGWYWEETDQSNLMCMSIDTMVEIAGLGGKPFCSEPEEVCNMFRPCCGRDWVCRRRGAPLGVCVHCIPANGQCEHSRECCLGVCIDGQCRHVMATTE
ncbi:unnamed protein product [Echinostoma caproni]|uniref:UPF0506 domain-containing protein n=1 Tax=Echinostoma caproni TaxID=27848 RepID=A0A183AFK1_9TREM|nr:unnamed protein product [Echinostoma caproni]